MTEPVDEKPERDGRALQVSLAKFDPFLWVITWYLGQVPASRPRRGGFWRL